MSIQYLENLQARNNVFLLVSPGIIELVLQNLTAAQHSARAAKAINSDLAEAVQDLRQKASKVILDPGVGSNIIDFPYKFSPKRQKRTKI
jgi:hypothetical protein